MCEHLMEVYMKFTKYDFEVAFAWSTYLKLQSVHHQQMLCCGQSWCTENHLWMIGTNIKMNTAFFILVLRIEEYGEEVGKWEVKGRGGGVEGQLIEESTYSQAFTVWQVQTVYMWVVHWLFSVTYSSLL